MQFLIQCIIRLILPNGGSGISKIRSISQVSLPSSVTPVQYISFYLQVTKNLASWVYCSRALHCSHHYPFASDAHAQAHLETTLLLPWMLSFGTTFSISCSFINSGLCCASHRYFLCASHCYCPSCMRCFPAPDFHCRTMNFSSCKAHSIVPRYGCKVKEMLSTELKPYFGVLG